MDDLCLSVIALPLMGKNLLLYPCLGGRYSIFSIKGGAINERHRPFMVNLPLPCSTCSNRFLFDPPYTNAVTAPAASSATFSTVETTTTTSFISYHCSNPCFQSAIAICHNDLFNFIKLVKQKKNAH